MKLIEKINVYDVIVRHLKTLTNASTKKAESGDYFLFLIFPIIVTSILLYFKIYLNKDFVGILATSLSIFIGLFFNVIVLMFDLVNKTKRESVKNLLLKELLLNISFEIFISVFCILFSIISLCENCYIKLISNAISYFLTTLFFTTLLMILKRTFNIFIKELEDPDSVNSDY